MSTLNKIDHEVGIETAVELDDKVQDGVSLPTDEVLYYSYDVLDKQYRLYGWFDTKMQGMLAINGAAAAAITFFLTNAEYLNNQASELSLYISLFFLVLGLLMILFHTIPKMDSGVSTEIGTRSLVHIVKLSKDEYLAKVVQSSSHDILRMNCQQISGMARNNVQSNAILRRSAGALFIGMLALGAALVFGVWLGDQGNTMEMLEQQTLPASNVTVPHDANTAVLKDPVSKEAIENSGRE